MTRKEDVWVHLVDVEGFVTADSPNLREIEANGAILRACSIGGYAVPVGAADNPS